MGKQVAKSALALLQEVAWHLSQLLKNLGRKGKA